SGPDDYPARKPLKYVRNLLVKPVFSRKISLLSLLVGGVMLHPAQAQTDDAQARLDAMVGRYCLDCHNFEDWAGGVAFDAMSAEGIHGDADVWENALRKLRGRLMPPPGNPQPVQAELDSFVAWMENRLDQNPQRPRAGHVPLQRLNRYEYSQAVKALLDVDIDASEYLPADIEDRKSVV